MRSAPSTNINCSIRKLEFRINSYVKALRISLSLNFYYPSNVGLHFTFNFTQIIVVYLDIGSHGQTCISHPMIIVRSSRSRTVRSCNYTSFSLNIDILIEKSVHFIVKRLIESRSSSPVEADISTRTFSSREEAPWSIIWLLFLLSQKSGWFPTASFCLAFSLIDSKKSTINSFIK